MTTLKGENIFLRALEPEDLDFLFKIENNTDFWAISSTTIPFSKFTLRSYLENAHKSIFEAQQFRFVIQNGKNPIGLIDLFDFDPLNRRAGVGIIIEAEENQGKGYGKESFLILKKYAFEVLNLHQLYANIQQSNHKSIALFESCGFEKVGVKKEWNLIAGSYEDEILYQLINKDVH